MQLEIGISTSRYLPASGTAGLARSRVRGNKRVPWPPPIMMESTLLALADMRALSNIAKSFLADARSEEHTSELQSPVHLVCRLLLEKKKNEVYKHSHHDRKSQILSSASRT